MAFAAQTTAAQPWPGGPCGLKSFLKHSAWPQRREETVVFLFLLPLVFHALEAYAHSRPRQEVKPMPLTSEAAYCRVSSRCDFSLDLPEGEGAG